MAGSIINNNRNDNSNNINNNNNNNNRNNISNNLQIVQWNARSIRNCLSDLKIATYTLKPHIVAIQETWLKLKDKTPGFISYEVLRTDRQLRGARQGGGGTMMLIRRDLNYNVKKLIPYNNAILEIQAITIKQKEKLIVL